MWESIKPYFIRIYLFLNLTFYLFIFLLPITRLINLYCGHMEYFCFLGSLYASCFIIVLIIGSSHLSFIYYFAFRFFSFTEKFWSKSYFFLADNCWFNFIANSIILVTFYYFIPPNFWFIYVFYYWFFIMFNLLFFKVYFSQIVVHGDVDPETMFMDSLVIRDVYSKLFNESLSHYFFFCRRFNVDCYRFKHKFDIIEVELRKKRASTLKHFQSFGTEGYRMGIPSINYRILLISSSVSASLGFIFIRCHIWV